MDHPDPARLATVGLFATLPADQLAQLAPWFEIEDYRAGTPIVRVDSAGYAFFVIDAGTAHAELDGKRLEDLGPGSVFGEMAFFAPDGHRSATVVADTDVTTYTLFGTRFRQLQLELPEVAASIETLVRERAARVDAAK